MTPQEHKKCKLCGEPMPEGEEMFYYHGYSCDCPKPPLKKVESPTPKEEWEKALDKTQLITKAGAWIECSDYEGTVNEIKSLIFSLICKAKQEKQIEILKTLEWALDNYTDFQQCEWANYRGTKSCGELFIEKYLSSCLDPKIPQEPKE